MTVISADDPVPMVTRRDPIDATVALISASSVKAVDLDGELVLVDGWRRADVLSHSGARIWARIDGAATLGEIAASIDGDVGLDPDAIEPDVVAFARQVARDGFFANVDPHGGEGLPDVRLVPIEPVTYASSVIDDFEAVDPQGDPIRLLDFAADICLIVNWSPRYGSCASITTRSARSSRPWPKPASTWRCSVMAAPNRTAPNSPRSAGTPVCC